MKQLSLFVLIISFLGLTVPTLAQENSDLITLNDANPAIDVVITLPSDSTGTIELDFAQVSIRLTDDRGAVVFFANDPRLHGLSLNIAPNTGTHTLTIERLAGVAEGTVRVISMPEMLVNGTAELVTGNALTFNQEVAFTLDTVNRGGGATVSIPSASIGAVTATFPGANASTQFVDRAGKVISESAGGHVDGVTFVIDGGDYQFRVFASDLTDSVVVGIRAIPVDEAGFAVLAAPVSAQAVADTSSQGVCTAMIMPTSVNLRSGPGTGYSILGYGYRGEEFVVGGQNTEGNWAVIGNARGTAWVTMDAIQTSGACQSLTVYNIPLRDSTPAQVVITSPNGTRGHEENEHEAHESHEGEEHDDD